MTRGVGVAAVVLTVFGLGVGTAHAHAGFESSDPADGAVLDAAPADVTITFTEPPDPALSSIQVLDAGGSDVAAGRPTGSGRSLTVPMPAELPDGAYTVAWRVVSTTDGHPTSGSFAFGIGAPPPTTPAEVDETTAPTPLSVAAKVAFYAGAMLLLAVAVVGLGLFGGRPASLHIAGIVGAVLALIGASLMLVAEQRTLDVPMADLLSSQTGRPYLWLLAAVLVADACAVVAAARPRWRSALWGAGGAAAAAMLVRTTSGHAAAATLAWWQEGLQWVHFMAAGVWIGGLAILFVLARSSEHPPVAEARRFSSLAAVAVGVVVATGLLRSWSELGGVGWILRAFETSYGTTLLLKVAVVVGVIALGAVNRFRTLPRLTGSDRPLRRIVGSEVVAAFGVLLLTATLTGFNPNATPADTGTPAPTSVTAEGSDFATTTRVRLTVTPGVAGANRFDARVLDFDAGTPSPADQVTLRLRSVTRPGVPAATVDLARSGDTWTSESGALSFAGTWNVVATVRSGSDVVEVPVVLITRQDGASQTVVAEQGLPTLVTTSFPDGVEIETFVDPGSAGVNQVHLTVFAADGVGLPTTGLVAVATPEAGPPQRLPQRPFGDGHAIAQADLDPGSWTFDVVATAADGGVYQATWTEAIEERA